MPYLNITWLWIAINSLLCICILLTVYMESQTLWNVSHTNFIPKTINQPLPQHAEIHLADYFIFGKPTIVNSEKPQQWTLRGIIQEKNNMNTAIIGTSDVDEATYNVGDQLADGSVIIQILPDQVLLSRNGQVETLTINWETEKNDIDVSVDNKNED